jgi:hypothetical protein
MGTQPAPSRPNCAAPHARRCRAAGALEPSRRRRCSAAEHRVKSRRPRSTAWRARARIAVGTRRYRRGGSGLAWSTRSGLHAGCSAARAAPAYRLVGGVEVAGRGAWCVIGSPMPTGYRRIRSGRHGRIPEPPGSPRALPAARRRLDCPRVGAAAGAARCAHLARRSWLEWSVIEEGPAFRRLSHGG